jgi:uroporphyrin-III C-methyltransferase
MNELPTFPEQSAPPAAVIPAVIPAAAPHKPAPTIVDILQRPLTVAVIVLAVLLAVQAWSSHNQVRNLREEIARRLQKNDVLNMETNTLSKTVQETQKELQQRVGVLENRQTEAQSQQSALEQLYQDLSKNRDEWALAEIEQVLSTASQQLQLAGNVQGALIALQNADRTLLRSGKPQFITIRRAIAKDSEKLKALPNLDLIGIALRLDSVIGQLDTLPMLSDATPTDAAPKNGRARRDRTAAAGGAAAGPAWLSGLKDIWHSWSAEMWGEMRQLIRVRSVETPDALMVSPEQTYFLRENLKLRLLNARLALLSRNEAAFRGDLIAAQDTLAKYFDTRAKQTQTAQALLRQVQASELAIEMPTLSESLNAVRNYKAKP